MNTKTMTLDDIMDDTTAGLNGNSPRVMEALIEAYNALPEGAGARSTIRAMLLQEDCGRFNPGKDFLTELCDTIIFG